MYAVIETGGKQYKVSPGEEIRVEKIAQEIGTSVDFTKVLLMVNGTEVNVGTPYLADVKITGEIVNQLKGDKVVIVKFRRRKHYMRKQGHRQLYSVVKLSEVW